MGYFHVYPVYRTGQAGAVFLRRFPSDPARNIAARGLRRFGNLLQGKLWLAIAGQQSVRLLESVRELRIAKTAEERRIGQHIHQVNIMAGEVVPGFRERIAPWLVYSLWL